MNFEDYTFQYQSESAIECRREKENGAIEIKLIVKGETFEDENGETVNRWEELHASGVEIQKRDPLLVEAENQAIEKAQVHKTKLQGALINGEQISLTEENQNGMAAVMQGVNLAAEMGADIFPLNFNAQTPAGFKLMTFKAAADFKTFCLTFMAERQKFFK